MIDNSGLNEMSARKDAALEALDIAIKAAHNDSRLRHARALGGVKELLLAGMTPREARRSEADAEAVLSSLGYIARPGPRAPIDPDILDCVTESLRGPFRLRIRYGDDNAMRLVEPHGLQLGPRSYLVARQKGRGEDFLSFRLDRIVEALCTDEAFDLDPQFSITEYSQRAFGAFHDPSQYGEVVWRFNPSAAKRALEFQFHPRQDLNFEEDGSLTVRFEAAGWLEMAWFLYQWGDSVEVLAPQALRDFTYPYRRSDFPSLP